MGKWRRKEKKIGSSWFYYLEIQNKVNELLNIASDNKDYYPKSNYKVNSLVDALKELGIDSSFINRIKIANKNGINVYFGLASQNIKLLHLLKNGKLKKI